MLGKVKTMAALGGAVASGSVRGKTNATISVKERTTMDMDVTITSGKDFDATVRAVVEETAAAKFRVLATHDVSATLAERGFDRERVTIIEVCNAKHAHAVLATDVRIGLMLPCPIMVYAEGDAVKVTTMRPTIIGGFFPQADLGDVPDEVEQAIVRIMERAAV